MNRFLQRKNKGELHCYASGDGALHFSWVNPKGIASGAKVTEGEVRAYLNLEAAKHLRERGWRPFCLWGQWCLIADVRRLGPNKLQYEGTEYAYSVDGEVTTCTQQNYHRLTITFVRDEEPFEVRNLSVKAAITHYLTYEEEITAGETANCTQA